MDTPLKEGEILTVGNYQIRNFKGYRQSREGTKGTWKFHISGFDSSSAGQDGFCTVVMMSGGSDTVPIDANNSITINGKKYDESHWIH